jgi:amidase
VRPDATFITRLDPGRSAGDGPTLAVKDLIDVEGVPTTAASRAVADTALPAERDAACMSGARAAGARIVGKANLHELAFGASGVNEAFGTPRNPFGADLVPGGSSSGSAVAVATFQADLAYGSDTGGSIRVPSAFCGTVGLKTTFGRVPTAGVHPLAPSLDTVGPMGRTVEDVTLAMALLEPGFVRAGSGEVSLVGRVHPQGVAIDPVIDAAIDAALAAAGLDIIEVELPEWSAAFAATAAILDSEAAVANRHLTSEPGLRGLLGAGTRERLERGSAVGADRVAAGRAFGSRWRDQLDAAFRQAQILVLPTVGFFAPRIEEASRHQFTLCTAPVNLAGLPAVALPVPTRAAPASLQMVGPAGSEELLLAAALVLESAAATLT